MLCVLDTGIASAEMNMSLDAKLLNELNSTPVLHLYDWKGPSATYGHFIQPEKHLDLLFIDKHQLSIARRPTGGGIVFHIWDYAFSFLMPATHPLFSLNTLENYRFVNLVVLDVIKEFLSLQAPLGLIKDSLPVQGVDCQNFCMARPTQYDVVYNGVKIAGAAQRKTKRGYLHQGTISLAFPDEEFLRDVLLVKSDVVNAMRAYTFAPLGRLSDSKILNAARAEIGRRLASAFQALV